MKKIAVVGLGYVGLPLSLQFAQKGVTVIGLDVDAVKTDALREGKSYIRHIAPGEVAAAVDRALFDPTTDSPAWRRLTR